MSTSQLNSKCLLSSGAGLLPHFCLRTNPADFFNVSCHCPTFRCFALPPGCQTDLLHPETLLDQDEAFWVSSLAVCLKGPWSLSCLFYSFLSCPISMFQLWFVTLLCSARSWHSFHCLYLSEPVLHNSLAAAFRG